MTGIAHILTGFSAAAAGSQVTAIWEGTVLAAAVALCLHFVKGITAGVRSMLWTAVLLLVVLLHFLPLVGQSSSTSPAAGHLFHLDLRWSLAIAGLWLLLSLFRGAQLIHSAIGLRRVARTAMPIAPSPECVLLLHTRFRSAELCTSTEVDRPSVIGFFKPRVLIPESLFEKLSAPELEQIVLHEMEHLRRGDDWTNLVQKISLVLFPLNPVLLWVERRLRVERELACDDRVLSVTNAKKAYATCLVNLAEHTVLRRGAMLVLGAWERQSELGQRVRRILRQPEGMMDRRQLRLVTGVLMVGMIGGVATLAREPQLVSFAPQAMRAEAEIVPPAAYVPASFRSETKISGATTPHMMDAMFHEPVKEPAKATTAPKKPRVRRAASRTFRNVLAPQGAPERRIDMTRISVPDATQGAAWVLLTDWTDAPAPSHLRFVVSDGVYSYAAVPVANGWLIVQL